MPSLSPSPLSLPDISFIIPWEQQLWGYQQHCWLNRASCASYCWKVKSTEMQYNLLHPIYLVNSHLPDGQQLSTSPWNSKSGSLSSVYSVASLFLKNLSNTDGSLTGQQDFR